MSASERSQCACLNLCYFSAVTSLFTLCFKNITWERGTCVESSHTKQSRCVPSANESNTGQGISKTPVSNLALSMSCPLSSRLPYLLTDHPSTSSIYWHCTRKVRNTTISSDDPSGRAVKGIGLRSLAC